MLTCLLALAAAPLCPQQDDAAIRKTLGITNWSIQAVTPAATERGATHLDLNLGGLLCTADLTLDPIDTPDCTMLLDDGQRLHEAPPPAPCTYRGSIRNLPGSIVSGSLIDGQFTGLVLMPDGLPSWNIVPLTLVNPGADRADHVLFRFEDSEPGNWRCGVTERALNGAPATGSPDTVLYCDLAIEADYPYYQALGSISASVVAQDISTVIANVTSYAMLSGAQLRFRIVRYVIRVSSAGNPGAYNTSDATNLLVGFRNVWNNNAAAISRDIAHMFTGRDLNGSTIGIAYVGTVCSPTSGYGLSQSRFSLQPGRRAALTAHEIGHNFSANHCETEPNICTPCWLMLGYQGSTTNELTRYGCSTSVISGYAATRQCLSPNLLIAPCAPDFDANGLLNASDLAAFQSAFFSREPRADIDASGGLDIRDFAAFLNLYAAGCP